MRGSFLVDIVGSFPLNLVLLSIYPDSTFGDEAERGDNTPGVDRLNRMLRLLRLSKLVKLFRMLKLAKYLEGVDRFISAGVFSIIKLIVLAIMCCHWFVCLRRPVVWDLVSDLLTLTAAPPSPSPPTELTPHHQPPP